MSQHCRYCGRDTEPTREGACSFCNAPLKPFVEVPEPEEEYDSELDGPNWESDSPSLVRLVLTIAVALVSLAIMLPIIMQVLGGHFF